MDLAILVAVGAGAAALLLALLVTLVVLVLGRRRKVEAELARSRAELAALRARLDALAVPPSKDPVGQEFVITDLSDRPVGRPADRTAERTVVRRTEETPPLDITAGGFVSLAVGESLVKLVALSHGLRRAMTPENRNRIAFEMRRELRRSRKERKREIREARRYLRAEDTAA